MVGANGSLPAGPPWRSSPPQGSGRARLLPRAGGGHSEAARGGGKLGYCWIELGGIGMKLWNVPAPPDTIVGSPTGRGTAYVGCRLLRACAVSYPTAAVWYPTCTSR